MYRIDYEHRGQDPRVLVVSQRRLQRSISRSTIFEFEDLIAQFDSVDIVSPQSTPEGGRVRQRLRRMADKWSTRLFGRQAVDDRKCRPQLDRQYDLLFVSCEDISDLLRIGSMRAWHDAARFSVCYVEELWEVDVERRAAEVALLGQFDLILLSCAGGAAALSKKTGKPVHYLAPAVDAALFCPYPNPPKRCIDVYNMGRRSGPTHAALLRQARQADFFYVYDTFAGNEAINPPEHRLLFGNLVKRSKFFVANRAKINEPHLTSQQEEIGSRHFEGAAGGAVIIGDPPQCDAFHELLDWPDSVVAMPFDAPDIVDRIAELEKDPDRLARIRADNVRNSLLRHDWAWRWEQTLAAAGIEALPQLGRRQERLAELAAMVP